MLKVKQPLRSGLRGFWSLLEYVDNESTPEDTFILKADTINEVRNLIKGVSDGKAKAAKCAETEETADC